MTDVILVDPPPVKIVESHDIREYPHLGLAYIASYVRSRGIHCSIIDGKFQRKSMDSVLKEILVGNPKIVGITAMTHEISQAAKVAKEIKAKNSNIVTIIGGPHATALPSQVLIDFPVFDVAVFGEGEYTFYELIKTIENNKDIGDILGITYRAATGIKQNSARPPISEIDDLPFPAWDLLPRSKTYPVITARGCPFNCNFCMRVLGNKVRFRKPENVIAELKQLVEFYHPKTLHFMDETFTINKTNTDKLLDLMISNGFSAKTKWDAQTRVDQVNPDLLLKMKSAGCEWIGFGIESGNREVLNRSGKGIKIYQVVEAVKIAKKVGLKTNGFFILGHPFETAQTAKDTINLAAHLNTNQVTFGIMVPYPGTEIYEMAMNGDGNYHLLSRDWRDFNKNLGNSLELTTLSRKNLELLQVLAYTKFYLFNLRFGDGAKYLFSQRRLAFAIFKKAIA